MLPAQPLFLIFLIIFHKIRFRFLNVSIMSTYLKYNLRLHNIKMGLKTISGISINVIYYKYIHIQTLYIHIHVCFESIINNMFSHIDWHLITMNKHTFIFRLQHIKNTNVFTERIWINFCAHNEYLYVFVQLQLKEIYWNL